MIAVRVILPLPSVPPLDYLCSTQASIGNLVTVPFRKKQVTGIIIEIAPANQFSGDLKAVTELLPFTLSEQFLQFIYKAQKYYLADLGSLVKMVLPSSLGDAGKPNQQREEFKLRPLSQPQEKALGDIKQSPLPVALLGVTGSGKTEIYFHLIRENLAQGKQSLLLVPEIALAQHLLSGFKESFGFEADIWHSSVSASKKQKILTNILNGSTRVVIGARSSLFLPYKNLGLIIVDEEHDQAYKQESSVQYNARDMAVLRAHITKCKVLLGSATLSAETFYNCKQGKYNLVKLEQRYHKVDLPDTYVIDMRRFKPQTGKWISEELIKPLKECLAASEQALLFLNRKGYAPMLICGSCGFRVSCSSCSTYLVLHKKRARLECHKCGFGCRVPDACQVCDTKNALYPCGPGIERLYDEVKVLFPNARVLTISREDFSTSKKAKQVLEQIKNSQVDIIIGTQIVTKGHHFPNLNLVGIIDADLGLSNYDLKSFEQTFQILQQVGGRAGRETAGKVFIQTFQKDNPVMAYVKDNNYCDFIEYELRNRASSMLPPFAKSAILTFVSSKAEKAKDLAKQALEASPKVGKQLQIWGPAPALIAKLKGTYRYKLLVLSSKEVFLQSYLQNWLSKLKIPWDVKLKLDIDPYNLL